MNSPYNTLARAHLVIESVKLAVQDDLGNYLLLTRSDDDPNRPNSGDLPGGGLEANETPYEAALREAEEEIGLFLHPAQFFRQVRVNRPSSHGHTNARFILSAVITAAQKEQVTLDAREHKAHMWLPAPDVYFGLGHEPLREGFALVTGMTAMHYATELTLA